MENKTLFGPCVRYGSMTMDETHPCYFCGFPIPVTLEYCKCGIVPCPECHNCYCTITKEVQDALVKLRNKYCCNPINFARGIGYETDSDLQKLVPHYKTAFNYCRNLELESAKRLNGLDEPQRRSTGSQSGAVPS